MEYLIEKMRDVLGTPEFYVQLGSSNNYSWDYGAMLEYMFSGILLCIVVASVFKILSKVFG